MPPTTTAFVSHKYKEGTYGRQRQRPRWQRGVGLRFVNGMTVGHRDAVAAKLYGECLQMALVNCGCFAECLVTMSGTFRRAGDTKSDNCVILNCCDSQLEQRCSFTSNGPPVVLPQQRWRTKVTNKRFPRRKILCGSAFIGWYSWNSDRNS